MADRYQTGQKCPKTGTYDFDGYTDGTWSPAPTAEEKRIPMREGGTFPPINSADKACWWRFAY